MRRLLVLAAVLVAGMTAAADDTFTLTGENTKVEFIGTKKDGKHTGGFKTLTGTITAGADLTKAVVDVTIETESLYSDADKLTEHLKAADFFDVKTNPKSTFKSAKIAKSDAGYDITGDLTLCGKSKAVTLPAKFAVADGKATLEAEFKINRTEFGMSAVPVGKVDDAVTIKVSVAAKK